jgi:replicative DNA helicase
VCIISLNQLNRNKDSRAKNDKQIMMSDIRNTGDLEQDAKIIIFIERPEKDGILEFPDGLSTIGVASITIAKNRDGRTGNTRLEYNAPCAKFQKYQAVTTAAALEHPSKVKHKNVNYHNYTEPKNNNDEFEGDNEPKF